MSGDAAQALRRALVEHLRAKGVLHEPRLAAAFLAVPRERFLPGRPLDEVYDDQAVVVKREGDVAVSSSSQPSMMALMLEQLQPQEGERILEIGTGSGYNAALLGMLAGASGVVRSLEIDPDLAEAARSRFPADEGNVEIRTADAESCAFAENFDRVIVTAAAGEISPAWFAALRDGGRLVVPLELGTLQMSVAFDRDGARLRSKSSVGALFMPLRGAAPHRGRCERIGDAPLILVRTAGPGAPDPEATWQRLLEGGTRAGGLALDEREAEELTAWLDVHDARFCVVSAAGPAVTLGLVPNLIERGAGAGGSVAFAAGLWTAGGFALLEMSKEGAFVRVYGDAAAGDALREAIAAWRACGSPGAGRLRVVVGFAGDHPESGPNDVTLVRDRSTMVLSWS